MPDTVKLPAIGPVKKQWVYIGGAVIVGIVGYAWWSRRGTAAPTGEVLPEDIPQDRLPPPTVVGSETYDPNEVRAIINTNAEWYTAAIEYLVSTGGFDFTFATITLGKFLARRELTESEANLVQAAKGAVGEPPQGGPWPIIRATAPGPDTSPEPLSRLPAPTGLRKVRDAGTGSALIDWNTVAGAEWYRVYRDGRPFSLLPTTAMIVPRRHSYSVAAIDSKIVKGKPSQVTGTTSGSIRV
jgi:hypothetical protein